MPNQVKDARPTKKLDRYHALVQKFPLRPLRSDEELDRAIEVIDSLIGRGGLDQGEQDYLDVLSNVVEQYETEEHPMRPVTDAEMLRHLIAARGITQKQLASDVGIAMSTISQVLHGRRTLNRDHIGALARYFSVSPAAFQH
jgi:HTH-type transcriptional regulator / antitoxin HigA